MSERISAPPRAARRPKTTSHHGVELTDDYAWLKADNWQEVMRRPEVLPADIRAHLEAENAHTAAVMGDTDALQRRLFAEMKARIKQDDSTVPAPDGLWAYYTSYVRGGEYPRLCRLPRQGGAEQILLDGNAMAAGLPFFAFGGSSHSPDHRRLAYAVDDKGSEFFTLRIRDLETATDLADTIPNVRGAGVWSADGTVLFYTRLDDNHRPFGVFRHVVGQSVEQDALVYREQDPGFFAAVGKTQSDRFIVISTSDHETSEVHLIDAQEPGAVPRCLARREPGIEYTVDHGGGPLIILTNADGAIDFKLCEAPTTATARAEWRDIEPHREGRLILSHTALRGHLIRLEREHGLPRIVVRRLADGAEHAIAFDEEAYSLALIDGFEADTRTIRFSYSSMTTPSQVFDYDVETRLRSLRKTQEVPSGHDPSRYLTRRVHARAKDGALVPISLLYLKSTPLDGTAPALLYGYGSYGMAMPAGFSTSRLSLVDRGFVYAIAHIRGGTEKGYRWYLDGKREKKANTFTDFIAAAEHLVAERFTAKGRIVAEGRSAGGLLMGAVANMAPDLFLGIIAGVPFVDALNTILDTSLPLTPIEWPEWGNPIESREAFEVIRAYSPYDNIAAKAYPHILATAGLTDPRVTYWEPAKWVAKLRAMRTDDRLLLLRVNMDAGHQGASGRFQSLKELAHDYAFALKVAGLAGGSGGETMKASLQQLLARIPGAKTDKWPLGEPFTEALRHGSMSVEVFAPRGKDTQEPHEQDELYFVVTGSAVFEHEGERTPASAGDVLFVPAGDRHHFEEMSGDFVTWVVFWGPKGGEG